MTTQLAWGAKVSPAFGRKVLAISEAIGCSPNDLMGCMAFESAVTFSPSVVNRISGATGLIQFMPKTARQMGTSTQALAALSAEDQLDYVARYFAPYRGKLASIDDLYMAILWPKAIGKSADYVLFDKKKKDRNDTSLAYLQNKGLDTNADGVVTKAEAAAKPRARLREGLRPENIADVGSAPLVDPGPAQADEAAADSDDAAVQDIVDAGRDAARREPLPPAIVKHVQTRLKELGYFTVGAADGELAGMTKGAIVRFKTDNALWPEDAAITAEFLGKLDDPATLPAPVSIERATTTAEDLRAKGSETITLTDRIKGAGAWLLGLVGFGGATEGGDLAEKVTTGTQIFSSLKHALSVIGLTPIALLWIGAAGIAVWFFANKLERHRVDQARTGQHL